MKSAKMMIAAAAMGGLIAGAAVHVSASALPGSQTVKKSFVQSQLGARAGATALDKHDCKGMNSCKGQGGCSAGDGGCKGKNSCKGKGGCKTDSVL